MPEEKSNQGIIESYIHSNKKIGVLLELGCQTDFVARTEDFKNLAHELCLQIAALGKAGEKKEETPLLRQAWIRNPSKTVKNLIDEYIVKLGEKIIIKRFTRYEI